MADLRLDLPADGDPPHWTPEWPPDWLIALSQPTLNARPDPQVWYVSTPSNSCVSGRLPDTDPSRAFLEWPVSDDGALAGNDH